MNGTSDPARRTVVIIGAAGGLGRACVDGFAAEGARLVLMGRRVDALGAVAADVDGHVVVRRCDATDPADVAAAFDGIEPDVVVHAAGANRPQPFVDVSPDTFDELMAVNVRSAFLVGQAAARSMLPRQIGGVVVMITSQMGHVGAVNRTVYCTAKHAVEGLIKAMAVELAPSGIRVVGVAPTFVDTPMTAPYLASPRARAEVVEQIPLGRLGTPAEVAAAVVFAASPGASLMTGSSVLVDGGWCAR